MKKIIVITEPPKEGVAKRTLNAAIAHVLSHAMMLIEGVPHKHDDYTETAETLIEILGEDNVKELAKMQDPMEIPREFTLKNKGIEQVKLAEIEQDERPWYTRFQNPRKKDVNKIQNQRFNKKIFKKGTRKK
jgi:predicted patatin/cPLA2 family phospholipase